MSINKIYKWGIIGCGTITPKFVDSMGKVSSGKIIHIGSNQNENVASFAQKYAIANFGNYDSVLNNPEVDIVYINNTNNLHEDTVLQAIQKGKHVLCEKPMGMSYEGTLKLIELSKEKNIFLMEGLWTRFLPIYKKFDELKKQIGKIQKITVDFGFKGIWGPDRRLLNKELIGGTLMDNGIYPIAFPYFILDEYPLNIDSKAIIGTTGVDESASYKLYFSDNKIAELESSIVKETPQQAIIYGDKGKVEIPLFWKADTLKLYLNNTEEVRVEKAPYSVGFEYEIEEVHNCLDANKIESEKMSHKHSLDISKLMEEIKHKQKR